MKVMDVQGAVKAIGLESVARVTGMPRKRVGLKDGKVEWVSETPCCIDYLEATLVAHYLVDPEEEPYIVQRGLAAHEWEVDQYSIH